MTTQSPGASPGDVGGTRFRPVGGRPILACYYALGDPLFDDEIRGIYVECGVDIVELGIPARDPYLDGPDVAGAMRRSIEAGADPYERMRDIVAWLRARGGTPAAVCMAYSDLELERITADTLAGLDGFLVIDRPSRPDNFLFMKIMRSHGICDCGFVPLGFSEAQICDAAGLDGYVMMQAASGVTGPRETFDPRLQASIARLKRGGIQKPILAGFGIGTAAQARAAVDLGADGVVIGSMCVRKVMQGPQAIRGFLQDVRASLDA